MLVDPKILHGDKSDFHVIAYSSTIIRRVCRATLQAEAYALQDGVEEGDNVCIKISSHAADIGYEYVL